MAKVRERLKAVQLRRMGESIKAIANTLGVSKSSVSIWCRDIKLSPAQVNRLNEKMLIGQYAGRLKGAEVNRKNKETRIAFFEKLGKNEVGQLSRRDFLIAGIALYWGEGSKSGNCVFSNTDPSTIHFMYRWFRICCHVAKEDFRPYVYINIVHEPRAVEVMRFWSRLLNLPEKQLRGPMFVNAKIRKKYDNYNNYHGVVALRVSSGTNLRNKILGMIKELKHNAGVA